MLTIKERQTYLKKYGFYTGKVDGIEGPLTKKAYLALQKKYFVRKKDIDGIYGPNTDILLVNLHRVKTYTKNFELKEFKCGCKGKHCTGYPEYLSIQMLKNLQATRNWLKKPISIRSGLRCIRYNAKLKGSSAKSGHLKGKAVDMYSYPKSLTAKGRKQIIAYFKKLPGYYYAYQGTSNMGFSTHLEVKE